MEHRRVFKYIFCLVLVGALLNLTHRIFSRLDDLDGEIYRVKESAKAANNKAEEALERR